MAMMILYRLLTVCSLYIAKDSRVWCIEHELKCEYDALAEQVKIDITGGNVCCREVENAIIQTRSVG